MYWSYVAFFKFGFPNSATSYKRIGSRKRQSRAKWSSLKANQRDVRLVEFWRHLLPDPHPPLPGRAEKLNSLLSGEGVVMPYPPSVCHWRHCILRRWKKARLRGSCLLLRHLPCILQRGGRVPVTSTTTIPVSGPLQRKNLFGRFCSLDPHFSRQDNRGYLPYFFPCTSLSLESCVSSVSL